MKIDRKKAAGKGRHAPYRCPVSNIKGTTLVELMVTLVLIGMFLTASASAMVSGLQIFYQMKATSNAMTVSDTILDKIAGELTAARKTVLISESGDAAAFYTRTGSPAYITVTEGEMRMHYYPVENSLGGQELLYEAADWTFDKKMYQGFTVDSLQFTDWSTEGREVLEISLCLKQGDFTYQDTRWVECTDPELKRIGAGAEITDEPQSFFNSMEQTKDQQK